METGDVVWANAGDGDVLAHYIEPAGDKDVIQMPDGTRRSLTYRAPSDRDEHGPGTTWWQVGDE